MARKHASLRVALLAGVCALALGGCVTTTEKATTVAAVNPDYRAGLVDIPTLPLPSLEQVINQAPSRKAETVSTEDRLRGGAMRDGALSYGARAGLAWESRAINRMLQDKSAEIARTYDFNRAMIKGPGNAMIMPPVISQANETWETSEAGRTLRVADRVYEIVEQARFSAVAPQWQTYLIRDYKSPEAPPDVLLPRDGDEREQWKRWVTEGWQQGQRQAQEIFKVDLERLERDFNGMVRYKSLLEQGKVSAPVVADSRLGTTGTGQDMRVGDRAIRITQDPKLNVGKTDGWSAPATTPGPDGVPTGAGPAAPKAEAPRKAAPVERRASAPAPRRAEARPVRVVPTGSRGWDEPPRPAASERPIF